MMKPAATLAALFSFAASPALAQESGEAALTIAGTELNFVLDAMQSDWSGDLQYASVNIGLKPQNNVSELTAVALSFEYQGLDATVEELRLLQNGTRLYGNESSDEGGVAVSIQDISADGDTLVVAGHVEGRVGPSDNFGRDIDLTQALEVSGSFQVRLRPE